MMKKIIAILLLVATIMTLIGCGRRESEAVSYNVSYEADNFNVIRRVAVINTINGEALFECIGRISLDTDNPNKLVIIVEVEKDKYKKHIIGLNEATTMYVVEDVNGTGVDKWAYEVNYNPKQLKILTFKDVD